MKKILSILILFLLFAVCFSKPAIAQLPTFTWRVTDQNGTPLAGAVVHVNFRLSSGEWGYAGSCNTNSSGRCSVSLSCATPCELRGDVEYQGYTGSYSGAYNDGAVIGVVINIPAPSPTPTPPPYPTPSPPPGNPCCDPCCAYDAAVTKMCTCPPTYFPSPTNCGPGEVCQLSGTTEYCPDDGLNKDRGVCVAEPAPPPPPPPPGYECGPSEGVRVSRPDACELCNATGLFCPSCATSFTVHDTVWYYWHEGTPEEPHCVEKEWGGIVTINASETTIPFVGFSGGENEELYLADYFEGTHEYYRDYPLRVGHGVNPIFMTNYQGVLRKLTPYEYQNQLKKEMIQRESSKQPGEEGAIHDYQLKYLGRLCWDAPLWMDILGAIADRLDFLPFEAWRVLSYCLYEVNLADTGIISAVDRLLDGLERDFNVKIPHWRETEVPGLLERDYYLSDLAGHFPPEPDEEDYVEKWNAWKESGGERWWKLWQVTPMISREDTPGYIAPYYGWKPLDTPRYIAPRAEQLPHVARLYEETQDVQNMLMPFVGSDGFVQEKIEPIIALADEERVIEGETLQAQADSPCGDVTQETTESIIASTEEKVLGEKTLLAQIPPIPRGCKFLYAKPDCGCCTRIKPDGEPDCIGRHTEYPIPNRMGPLCGWLYCEDGTPDFCGTGPSGPVDPGVCGLAGARPVGECEQPAITDTNPNDDICGPKIETDFTFIDRFINDDYTGPCIYETVCECPVEEVCDEEGNCICPVPEECHRELTNPECMNITVEDVSRRFGINLIHPYLTEIWEQTGTTDTNGLFNFFRPAEISEFQEIDAADEIHYSYDGDGVTPGVGNFYYNYLGGVQLSKEWLINALTPWVK